MEKPLMTDHQIQVMALAKGLLTYFVIRRKMLTILEDYLRYKSVKKYK